MNSWETTITASIFAAALTGCSVDSRQTQFASNSNQSGETSQSGDFSTLHGKPMVAQAPIGYPVDSEPMDSGMREMDAMLCFRMRL